MVVSAGSQWSVCVAISVDPVSCLGEHLIQHRFGQPAGKRVLLTGMIAPDQAAVIGQVENCGMAKLWFRARNVEPIERRKFRERRIPSQSAKRDDC